jgi:hypothetical protein
MKPISNRRGSTVSDLSAIMRDIIHYFPYNSFAPVLNLAGVATPDGLGGNCIDQARVLGERIRHETQYGISYFVDGRHHGLLAVRGDDAFYLDPYLLHHRPIRLPTADGSASGRAFPLIAGRLGTLTVQRRGTSLRVTKRLARPGARGYYRTHSFSFHLGHGLRAVLANSPEIALHAEVTTLSVRVLTPDLQLISYVYSIPERETYILDSSFTKHPRGTSGFEALLAVILRSVGLARGDFLDYVRAGIEAYWHQLDGKRIDYVYPNAITGGVISDEFLPG